MSAFRIRSHLLALLALLACHAPARRVAAEEAGAVQGAKATMKAGGADRGSRPRRGMGAKAPAAGAVGLPPMRDTPADALDTATHRHVEVLRIDRDFGKPHFDIVIDAWVPRDAPGRLADVRVWWLKRHRQDMRGPFGRRSLRHVSVRTRRLGPARIRLHLAAGDLAFAFDVENRGGTVVATSPVVLPGGRRIEGCRARSAVLHARKLLGIVRGIDRLSVTCRTPDGRLVTADAAPAVG